jgi:hypothetical protein
MICYFKNTSNTDKIHKAFLLVISLKVIYNNLLIAFLLIYRDMINESYDHNIFEGALVLLNGLYITSLWYFLIILSKGWQVTYFEFSEYNYQKFSFLYMTILVSLMFDDMLYFIINGESLDYVSITFITLSTIITT